MGRASREKKVWTTRDGKRADTPGRKCSDCAACMARDCEWLHGLWDDIMRPDRSGLLVRRSALDGSLCSVVDFRTGDGAMYTAPEIQDRLSRFAQRQGCLLVLLDSSGTPVGIVGNETLRQAFLSQLIEAQPRLASALVDDKVAGQVDRDALTPGVVAAEEQQRRLMTLADAARAEPSVVIAGSDLNPVMEFIQ
jgi:hypothetical protein